MNPSDIQPVSQRLDPYQQWEVYCQVEPEFSTWLNSHAKKRIFDLSYFDSVSIRNCAADFLTSQDSIQNGLSLYNKCYNVSGRNSSMGKQSLSGSALERLMKEVGFNGDTKAELFLAENYPSINRGLLEKAMDEESRHIRAQIKILKKLQAVDFHENEAAARRFHAINTSVKQRLDFLVIVEETFQVLTLHVYEMLCFDVLEWYQYQYLKEETRFLRKQNEDLSYQVAAIKTECDRWEALYLELKRKEIANGI